MLSFAIPGKVSEGRDCHFLHVFSMSAHVAMLHACILYGRYRYLQVPADPQEVRIVIPFVFLTFRLKLQWSKHAFCVVNTVISTSRRISKPPAQNRVPASRGCGFRMLLYSIAQRSSGVFVLGCATSLKASPPRDM